MRSLHIDQATESVKIFRISISFSDGRIRRQPHTLLFLGIRKHLTEYAHLRPVRR